MELKVVVVLQLFALAGIYGADSMPKALRQIVALLWSIAALTAMSAMILPTVF